MLNKEVCKRCKIRDQLGLSKHELLNFEYNWSKAFVACWTEGKYAWIGITLLPPIDCPYVAEHAVSQDAE